MVLDSQALGSLAAGFIEHSETRNLRLGGISHHDTARASKPAWSGTTVFRFVSRNPRIGFAGTAVPATASESAV